MDNKVFPASCPLASVLLCVLLGSCRLCVQLTGPTGQRLPLESEGAAVCMAVLDDDLQVTHSPSLTSFSQPLQEQKYALSLSPSSC